MKHREQPMPDVDNGFRPDNHDRRLSEEGRQSLLQVRDREARKPEDRGPPWLPDSQPYTGDSINFVPRTKYTS
jgi:hypothetical protein